MTSWASKLQINKTGVNLLVLFIPSVDRWSRAIDQDYWLEGALEMLGRCFGVQEP